MRDVPECHYYFTRESDVVYLLICMCLFIQISRKRTEQMLVLLFNKFTFIKSHLKSTYLFQFLIIIVKGSEYSTRKPADYKKQCTIRNVLCELRLFISLIIYSESQ